MIVKIHPEWNKLLQSEFKKEYFNELVQFVKQEYKTKTVYPPGQFIFNAFDLCPPDMTKVVIIGQDPYHGYNQAHGLSFSVQDGVSFPPSLRNIFKELMEDVSCTMPISGNLTHWAKQGVLLLNATLTVCEGMPGSHQNKGWETFTDKVIEIISKLKKNIVFILWGAYARKKKALIHAHEHLILESTHPSPFSAHNGFFNSKPFSKTNQYLETTNQNIIQW